MNSSIELSKDSNDLNNGFIYEEDTISMVTISDEDIDNYYLQATNDQIDGNDSIDYSLIEQFRAVENIELSGNQLNKSFEYIISMSNKSKMNNSNEELTTITNNLMNSNYNISSNNSSLSSLISSDSMVSKESNNMINNELSKKNEKSVFVNCKSLCSHLMKPITNKLINKILKKKKSTSSTLIKSTNTNENVNKTQINENQIRDNKINERKIRIKITHNKLRSNQQLDDLNMKTSEFDKMANNYFTKCGDIVYYNI